MCSAPPGVLSSGATEPRYSDLAAMDHLNAKGRGVRCAPKHAVRRGSRGAEEDQRIGLLPGMPTAADKWPFGIGSVMTLVGALGAAVTGACSVSVSGSPLRLMLPPPRPV